ncbi:hypothetical protein BGX38DRAFT_1269256 [Terfezia claveryi]|nr:hypothetical protein BGX38DRAFT_1269256 [Terfezia claveryi]
MGLAPGDRLPSVNEQPPNEAPERNRKEAREEQGHPELVTPPYQEISPERLSPLPLFRRRGLSHHLLLCRIRPPKVHSTSAERMERYESTDFDQGGRGDDWDAAPAFFVYLRRLTGSPGRD